MCIVAGLVPLLLTELTTPDSAPPAAAVIVLAAVVSAAATTAATSASFDSPSRRLAGSAAVALLESAVGVRSAAASAAGGATSAAAWIMKICTERRAHRGFHSREPDMLRAPRVDPARARLQRKHPAQRNGPSGGLYARRGHRAGRQGSV